MLKVGAHNIQDWTDENTKTVNVEDVKLHPFYNGIGLKADIAVLIINSIQFTDFIAPVCLWQGDDNLDLVVGKRGTVCKNYLVIIFRILLIFMYNIIFIN